MHFLSQAGDFFLSVAIWEATGWLYRRLHGKRRIEIKRTTKHVTILEDDRG